tara:strand:- start:155 stop:1021 length:867 start_codon:yes stop_codon:yes gene_type:complete
MFKKLGYFLELARPLHAIKSLIVFAPLFFTFEINIDLYLITLVAFTLFYLASSTIYVFNDIIDLEKDKLHHLKMNRPIASGRVTTKEAKYLLITLLIFTTFISFLFNEELFFIILIYLFINILYSLVLKKVFLVDIIVIAFGFILRLFAGAAIADISLSHWIIVITFLLASLLAVSKRMDTENIVSANSTSTSKLYTQKNIKVIILILTISLIGVYIFFTLFSEIIVKHNIMYLPINSIFVIFGVARYLYILSNNPINYDPITIFFSDHLLKITFILWILSFYVLSVI